MNGDALTECHRLPSALPRNFLFHPIVKKQATKV